MDTHMGVHTLYMRERNGNREKAFAYICASEEATPRLLKRYCRKVYELGYVPICPALADGQYLQTENPDEKRQFQSIARQKLGRCRMLVVCGNEISHAMSGEIGRKSATSSAPPSMGWPKLRKRMRTAVSDFRGRFFFPSRY